MSNPQQYTRRVRRSCAACSAIQPRQEAPDPCLGWLEGVQFACCGHGLTRRCYVVLEDGTTLRSEEAKEKQRELGGNPAPASWNRHVGWITEGKY